MAEPTVHTFDLSGPVCYCGKVHAQPTHTITHLPPREWQMPIPGTPLASWSPIPMCSWPPVPALSPEWADRLWELAQQPEPVILEPSRKIRIGVPQRTPPSLFQAAYGVSHDRFFDRADLIALARGDLLTAEMRRAADVGRLAELLVIGSGLVEDPPMTVPEAAWYAEVLMQRMEREGVISYP